tara:strand:- start:1160 stop:1399 length:240 start_codon:yes stop_codon:yes gene_type:complete
MTSSIDETTYHIYAKDKVLYCNLSEEDFEEKWEMLNIMVGILKTDYSHSDLSFEKLAPKVGFGGPGKVLWSEPAGDDSY